MPVTIDGTKGVSYPTWTTANRPTSPITGQAGYNTTLAQLELYNGTTWSTISIVLPTLLSITGDVYSGLATNLTILGTTLGLTPGIFRFTSGGVIADVSVTPVGTNTITIAVPASIRAIAAGNTVSIAFINDLGVSNIIVLPIYGLPNGGTRTTSGAYSYNAITSTTNLVITKQVDIEYLIIAGGGAGGAWGGGGNSTSLGGYGGVGGGGNGQGGTTPPTQTNGTANTGGGGGGTGAGAGTGNAMAKGGYVHGGLMFGPNPKGPDDGAVNLDMGEYVIKKSSVDKYGKGLLDMINEGKVPAKKMKSLLG